MTWLSAAQVQATTYISAACEADEDVLANGLHVSASGAEPLMRLPPLGWHSSQFKFTNRTSHNSAALSARLRARGLQTNHGYPKRGRLHSSQPPAYPKSPQVFQLQVKSN